MKLKPNKPNKNKKATFNFYWIYAIIAFLFIASYFWKSEPEMTEVNSNDLNTLVINQHVDKIVIVRKKEQAQIYLKKDSLLKHKDKYENFINSKSGKASDGPHYFNTIGSIETFNSNLEKTQDFILSQDTIGKTEEEKQEIVRNFKHLIVSYDNSKDWGLDILISILPFVVIIGIWIFIMRSMSRGSGGGASQMFNFGKSRAQVFDKDSGGVNVSFDDVAGLEGAKEEIEEIVDFLKSPKKYTDLGGKIPKGVLLVGPPGTGKTLLAKAVAGEAKVPFFTISGSDFVEMFVGVGASRVRDLFKTAKEKAPAIIFIDEIDAIGRARGKNAFSGSNDERENTLNALLTEMDGFSTNNGVIILAATNRADILDKALMRAGRFDRQIHVELPDVEERRDIFKVHIRGLKLAQDFDSEFFARQTPGFSGADIANVCNEAALIAARKAKSEIDKQDFLDAIDRIVGGLERRTKIISPQEKRVIAYHEAGHATVSWLLEHASPLVKVTIVPRGKSLGAAWYLPEERQITTFEQMYDEMTATLGGRASEDIFFGKVSTGALNDLERVSKQAHAIVKYFGMNEKIGNVSYFDSSGQNEYSFQKPYSDETARIIDKEVHELVEKSYNRAKEIIIEQKDNLEKLAQMLLEKEVIFREDVESIFGKRNYQDSAFIDNKDEDKTEENKINPSESDNNTEE
ncbi:MAG: ATP-dependent zinc metalloprotease FtsH [Bacteroidales bacterium]|jgi:cell division protease FtsH|nr:ATP-dependent zinc metalloprotease FtsH [Bacteroidales bacterium]